MQINHLYNCLTRHFDNIELLEDRIKITGQNQIGVSFARNLIEDYQDSIGEFYCRLESQGIIIITEDRVKPVGMD